jgi:hypothetical protein
LKLGRVAKTMFSYHHPRPVRAPRALDLPQDECDTGLQPGIGGTRAFAVANFVF